MYRFTFIMIMLMKAFSFADLPPISWSSTGIPAAYATKINLTIPCHRVRVSEVAPLLLVVRAAWQLLSIHCWPQWQRSHQWVFHKSSQKLKDSNNKFCQIGGPTNNMSGLFHPLSKHFPRLIQRIGMLHQRWQIEGRASTTGRRKVLGLAGGY